MKFCVGWKCLLLMRFVTHKAGQSLAFTRIMIEMPGQLGYYYLMVTKIPYVRSHCTLVVMVDSDGEKWTSLLFDLIVWEETILKIYPFIPEIFILFSHKLLKC